MKRVVPLLVLSGLASFVFLGCSTHREFSGWSLPKVNPLSWFKKESSSPSVTKPSEIAAGTRTTPPGYASVSSGTTVPGSPATGFPSSNPGGYVQPGVPSTSSSTPGVVWPGPQFQPSSMTPTSSIPGPQAGYYNPQGPPGAGVRVAERSQGAYDGFPTQATAPSYSGAWNPPMTNSSSPGYPPSSQGYPPYGAGAPQGTAPTGSVPAGGVSPPTGSWPQWPNPGSSSGVTPTGTLPPPNWQGSSSPNLGPRYDVNASRYNLSGSQQNAPAFSSGHASSAGTAVQDSRVWGYTPARFSPGGVGPSSASAGTPGTTAGASPAAGSVAGSPERSPGSAPVNGSSPGVATLPSQVQPTGFSTGQSVTFSGAGGTQTGSRTSSSQNWNPGGPTPNMPGRVDYQPGNTGYQPGVTGYQPPTSINSVGTSADGWPGGSGNVTQPSQGPSSQSQGVTPAGSSTQSPFLPGSIRPYVPPSSGTNSSSSGSSSGGTGSSSSALGQLGAATPSSTVSFCTLDGKCQ